MSKLSIKYRISEKINNYDLEIYKLKCYNGSNVTLAILVQIFYFVQLIYDLKTNPMSLKSNQTSTDVVNLHPLKSKHQSNNIHFNFQIDPQIIYLGLVCIYGFIFKKLDKHIYDKQNNAIAQKKYHEELLKLYNEMLESKLYTEDELNDIHDNISQDLLLCRSNEYQLDKIIKRVKAPYESRLKADAENKENYKELLLLVEKISGLQKYISTANEEDKIFNEAKNLKNDDQLKDINLTLRNKLEQLSSLFKKLCSKEEYDKKCLASINSILAFKGDLSEFQDDLLKHKLKNMKEELLITNLKALETNYKYLLGLELESMKFEVFDPGLEKTLNPQILEASQKTEPNNDLLLGDTINNIN